MAALVLSEIGTDKACYRDMSSFPETKAEKYANRSKGKKFLQYNRRQLSRIYPKGQRLDSSNYDPLPMWICGSQLVALNFQTPGKSSSSSRDTPQKFTFLVAQPPGPWLGVVWMSSPTSVPTLMGISLGCFVQNPSTQGWGLSAGGLPGLRDLLLEPRGSDLLCPPQTSRCS